MGIRVLVVDDEPSVLRLVCTVLSKEGFEVQAAPHPVQALEIAQTANPPFDVVVTDVIMPEMCGPELVQHIRSLCPEIGVVLMSAEIRSESLPFDAGFIGKPFSAKDLNALVRRMIPQHGESD